MPNGVQRLLLEMSPMKQRNKLLITGVLSCLLCGCATKHFDLDEALRFQLKHPEEAIYMRLHPAVLEPVETTAMFGWERLEGFANGVERRLNDPEELRAYLARRRAVWAKSREGEFTDYEEIKRHLKEGGQLYWYYYRRIYTSGEISHEFGEGFVVIRDGEIVYRLPYSHGKQHRARVFIRPRESVPDAVENVEGSK
jgi:hypothetical protein